jgi:hypothetical protein
MRIVDQVGIKVKRRKDRLATEAGAQRYSPKRGRKKINTENPEVGAQRTQSGRWRKERHAKLWEVGGGGGLREVEADYGGGRKGGRGGSVRGGRRRRCGELPLAGGFQGQVGEELAGGGSG